MQLQYAHSFKGSNTARHSREGGNPVRGLRRNAFLLDSRLRGNDAIRGFLHKLKGEERVDDNYEHDYEYEHGAGVGSEFGMSLI